jgi:hypothetical protein
VTVAGVDLNPARVRDSNGSLSGWQHALARLLIDDASSKRASEQHGEE